eukprot:Nitzschia sp. Nitz4//scaffold161_size51353//39683//41162//NITZ4_006956-RA/size51353-augustus-gene-0.52-mRNA-1//-1//CDS//3329537933//1057//frame0
MSSDLIGEYTERHLIKVAKDLLVKKTEGTTLLDAEAEARIPRFEADELNIGQVLGKGGFGIVSEINNITLKTKDTQEGPAVKHDDEHFIHNVVQDRTFMASHFIRQGKDYRYAIKQMKKTSRDDPQIYINALVDLALEARFLAVIRHPNIIKMRAVEAGEPISPDYFIVLDRLYDILPDRLRKWKKRKGGGLKKLLDVGGKKATAFWLERLAVAYDIACALNYLHEMSIVYRDLKPENLGFDVRGDIKVFDFGLAKELHIKDRLEDGTYKLTGDTGSLRYMAPEVGQNLSYNETVDVYSFAILCWQILEIETPYEGFTIKMIESKVQKQGVRPKMNPKWDHEICDLLRQCFVGNPKRPSMRDICEIIRGVIGKMSGEAYEEMDASRKSTLSAAQ